KNNYVELAEKYDTYIIDLHFAIGDTKYEDSKTVDKSLKEIKDI
ncbi:18269_t:CDS:1, partial [Gigaspora margarita]